MSGPPPASPPDAERRVFAARLGALPATAAFVADYCERHGIARDDALRLTLIVEELFTNSVTHGYGGDSDAPVELELAAGAGDVLLVYGDAAPPYDPLARPPVAALELEAPVEARRVGGLGLHLVARLAPGARYARENDRNRLWLSLRCGR